MMHNGVASLTAFLWEPEPEEQWENESDSEKSDDEGGEEDDGGEQPRATPANPDGYSAPAHPGTLSGGTTERTRESVVGQRPDPD
ncbi:hypothetical protein NX059_012131 [Plenodomus lindquistii]|nr:hypothetical protein NX059_012135 [Plenodomus lindquistii]KAI8930761.1 hypothetical protein NX059_012369 [Plenodomus lindquistii]KAI8931121.1 hypothetical protein NX059_012131 [Plenodomus lindquistii]